MNKVNYPFARLEGLDGNNVIATYKVFGVILEEAVNKFGNFAIGQTVETWIKVPGITDEMIEKYQARVLSYYLLSEQPETVFLLRVSFPTVNFAGNFATLLTSVLGNDVSTSLEVRLEDLEFVKDSLVDMGYKKVISPIDKLRKITGVKDRPLILNMIKPCLGFGPETGAAFFREVALGGMDIVKDDELLANPTYNPVKVKNDYLFAAKRTYESGIQTGTGGNLSARIIGGDKMLVKPSGFTYGNLSENNLIIVDFEGNLKEGEHKPTSESVLHGNIYKKYPWVGGIVHTHSPYSIMWSLSYDEIESITMHTQLKLKMNIPIIDVSTMVVIEDEMEKIYRVVNENPDIQAFVLKGHGIVALGKTAVAAGQTAELIEEMAKIYWEYKKTDQ